MAKGLLNTGATGAGQRSAAPDSVKAARRRTAGPGPAPDAEVAAVPPVSVDDLVMRSVNLLRSQDDALREMAYRRRVSKNDIVRAAVACKMGDWERGNGSDFLEDIKLGIVGISD